MSEEDEVITPQVVVPIRPERRVLNRSKVSPVAEALQKNGITRAGLIKQLVEISQSGEKVTVIEKQGVIVERKITRDPSIQMKALEKLTELLDRSEGLVQHERMTLDRKTYGS